MKWLVAFDSFHTRPVLTDQHQDEAGNHQDGAENKPEDIEQQEQPANDHQRTGDQQSAPAVTPWTDVQCQILLVVPRPISGR
jgi:hypothetical protein